MLLYEPKLSLKLELLIMAKTTEQPLLWHYTSFEVLISIFKKIDKPVMRATHIDFLNDKSEVEYGLHRIVDGLKNDNDNDNESIDYYIEQRERLVNLGGTMGMHFPPVDIGDFSALKEDVKNIETSVIAKQLWTEKPEYYTFSLSAAKDSLYQWLAYGPEKGGIALGFIQEFTTLIPIEGASKYSTNLIQSVNKIKYPQTDEKIVLIPPQGTNFDSEYLASNAVLIKHPAYKQEEEYRVTVNLSKLEDRSKIPVNYSATKPFIELPFQPYLLKEIYISPRGEKEQSIKLVKHFISNMSDLSHVKIRVSDIPFRD